MVERAATSQGVRFRGNANNTWDSARDVNSNNSVVNCNANNGGSAQRLTKTTCRRGQECRIYKTWQ